MNARTFGILDHLVFHGADAERLHEALRELDGYRCGLNIIFDQPHGEQFGALCERLAGSLKAVLGTAEGDLHSEQRGRRDAKSKMESDIDDLTTRLKTATGVHARANRCAKPALDDMIRRYGKWDKVPDPVRELIQAVMAPGSLDYLDEEVES